MIDCSSELDLYLKKLFPLARSLTGNENRKTLQILQELIPINIIEYPSGQAVYDWLIPKEWNIKDAWIKDENGNKIVDFANSNLHIVSYSTSIHKMMSFKELKNNLYFSEDLPDAIPYRTSYYKPDWGFCVTYNQFKSIFDENEFYEVCIDSEFYDGNLSIGELVIEGKSKQEILISSYICHPSMANDSLSGVLISAFLAKILLQNNNLEHSYRFVFVPETIGAIAYCANNEAVMKKIKNALVVTTCAGQGVYGYKKSWQDDNFINAMIEDVFNENEISFIAYDFDIHGSDERQYSSQAFRINCATITKDKYYEYKEYHTSLDNLNFVTKDALNQTLNLYLQLIEKMDINLKYKNLHPHCEVMLSKHDLYPKTGGAFMPGGSITKLDIILFLLFYADGTVSLYELSKKLKIDIKSLYAVAQELYSKNILSKIND